MFLAGPNYANNQSPAVSGGGDQLFGGSGEDQLLGGGGNDTMFGGADSDRIEGQDGSDEYFGGSGIDVLVLDVSADYAVLGGETLDGHFGNADEGDTPDDNATDIVLIEGTQAADTIRLSQTPAELLNVEYTDSARTRNITAKWRDEDGPLVEQFRISGLGGNDFIEFAQGANALNLDELNARSDDFVGVIDGGPGNDIQFGTSGRDRFDGGEGSDILFGLGGDDRLFGDGGTAPATDHDRLFGGQGHDDLIGGQGINDLYAWSQNPNVAFTELQFALGITTADPADSTSAAALIGLAPLPVLGRLSGDAKFSLSVGNAAPVNVTVLARDTREGVGAVGDANFTRADLITDINQALVAAGLGNQVLASLTADGKLRLAGDRTGDRSVTHAGYRRLRRVRAGPERSGQSALHRRRRREQRRPDWTAIRPSRPGSSRTPGSIASWAQPTPIACTAAAGWISCSATAARTRLFRADGSAFESLDGGVTGDEWKQYARETNKVWYYSGTNLNDVITVDFVTEPGLLEEHHLITRLTENNGNFTFDAQVQLDFQAKDATGNFIWDQQDVLFDPAQGVLVNPRDLGGLLPPEGDFLAIIVDALDGNDRVNVGPTVVKTVWVDAGAGDDRVEIASGSPVLIDGAERPQRNDAPANAFDLGTRGRQHDLHRSHARQPGRPGLLCGATRLGTADGRYGHHRRPVQERQAQAASPQPRRAGARQRGCVPGHRPRQPRSERARAPGRGDLPPARVLRPGADRL